jgi:DNA-binding response OmpR family regulator
MKPVAPLGGRVLIAATDDATRQVLCDVLGDEGYVVCACADVAEVSTALPAFRPHLVVTDLELPGGGLARVRRDVLRHAPRARVAILTALHEVDARRRAQDLGVDTHLNRPLALDRVVRVVRYLTAAGSATAAA